MSKLDLDKVGELFNTTRFVKYIPGISRLSGSNNVAILVGYLLFWNGLGSKKDCIYKTVEQMQEETGLSKHQQNSAIKFCKENGFLQVRLKGIPPKRHFYLDADCVVKWILEHPKFSTTYSQELNASSSENQPYITERYIDDLKITDTLFELYVREFGLDPNKNRLTTKRRAVLVERIEELDISGVKSAILGAAQDPYWNGTLEDGTTATFENIFGQYESAENFMNKWDPNY